MHTTTPLTTAGDAGKYFEKEDYYTRDGSGDKAWMGRGAEALGLTEVTRETFQAVLEGKDPEGNTLIRAASNGKHAVGWDLHFAPSKSISLVWAFGNDQERGDMLESHHHAVQSVMTYVEKHLIEARGRVDGTTRRMPTGTMVAARFDHFTSRELDPQLHSHVVVANMTKRKDGKWRAISNEKFFARELLTAMYENELAAELKERGYPIAMEKYDTGNSRYTRIVGIDERFVEHFGKRQEQIEEAMDKMQERYPHATRGELRQMACLNTRQPKKTIDREVLHESWNKQLQALGYTREDISRALSRKAGKERSQDLTPNDTVKLACSVINEQESTFSREDVMKIAARMSGGAHRNSALEEAFIRLKGKSIITLDRDAGVYTTAQMRGIEQGIMASVYEGRDTMPAVLGIHQVKERIAEYHLTGDQKEALAHILTSRDKVIGIQGDAGTGKTTMLGAAREELQAEGYAVRGMTFTGKAAKELHAGAGIDSQTLHSFLPRVENREILLAGKEAWVIDEASMVGSKQMDELIKAAQKANARVILVGDTKQLQSIDAGRMFERLQETGAMETVRMKETVRQKNEHYKEIVADMAEKKIDRAFEKMTRSGKVHEIGDDRERKDMIVKEFTSEKNYRTTLVVTPLNNDRRELNGHIRTVLRDKGTFTEQEYFIPTCEPRNIVPTDRHFAESYSLGDIVSVNRKFPGLKVGAQGKVTSIDAGKQTITITEAKGEHVIDVKTQGHKLGVYQEKLLPFTRGDKVVFLKNDRNLGVQNGLTGEITRLDARGNATVRLDSGKEITWNMRFGYNYLDHGYAVTDYKSQGQTSRKVIFHANTERATSYNSFYVALTRGKEDLRVYTDGVEKLREQVKREATKTSTLDHIKSVSLDHTKTMTPPSIERAQKINSGREGR